MPALSGNLVRLGEPMVASGPSMPASGANLLEQEVKSTGSGSKPHRTIDRVTRILEEVVYNPGMTFSELVRELDAAKSSVHGFVHGLLHNGWLYEENGRFYLGPAVYSLSLASGHIRAGVVTQADLEALHRDSGAAVFIGVRAGDHLIYIAETGSDTVSGFDARNNIRRTLLETAGGKILLTEAQDADREGYLRRIRSSSADLVSTFMNEYSEMRRTGLAMNSRRNGARFAIAAAVHNRTGEALASLTLVGPTAQIEPRKQDLGQMLLDRVRDMENRSIAPREAI